jgi:hypothetical protein
MLPRSPQLCKNGGLSVLCSVRETEKSKVGGEDSYVVFGQKFPGGKRKREIVCCHEATTSSFVAKV